MNRILTSETTKMIGETVTVMGWVNAKRDHGKITFVDLRDRKGIIQVVGGAEIKKLHSEDCIKVTGKIVERNDETKNPELETGNIELELSEIEILNPSEVIPFPLDTDGYDLDEVVRLKYRYLDLRRPRLSKMMKLRSDFFAAMRNYLIENDFTEVETPILTQSTKEGARDFVVPSRHNPGNFYALPQSPQQYKQLLMASGVEKYFQFARCFRDEDLRADRGFEFTQIDLEMSFVEQKDVLAAVEGMVKHSVKAVGGKLTHEEFPVLDYKEVIEKYGDDKFDIRTEEQKKNGELGFAWVINYPFFKKVDKDDAAEVADGKSGWTFTHNPFSSPTPEHLENHLKGENVEEILTTQYDLVCNGWEIGSGSIRGHKSEILEATYKIMGYSKEQLEASVGHMLEAFSFGAPPHGGIALGLDRLVTLLTGEKALKDAIAFPTTATGRVAVMTAPGKLEEKQLADLGLKIAAEDEDVPVYQKIVDALNARGVNYKHYAHKEVFTSEEAMEERDDQSLAEGAKALILRDNKKNHLLFVTPADKKVDMKELRKIIGVGKLEFAKKEWVDENVKLPFGSIPPFGSMMGLKCYVDADLGKNEEIVFNAARLDRSVRMPYKQFVEIEQPTIVTFE